MVLVVREFVRTRDPLIRDPLNTYTHTIVYTSILRLADWLTGMSDQSLSWSDISQVTFEKLLSSLKVPF